MQISLEWLSEYVDLPALDVLCEKLEDAGVEVEEIHDPTGKISGVVVGEVVSCEKHPEADRLSVCQVSDGTETSQVVCGAPNVAAGQRVAFAKVGANLGDFTIGRRKLRGVESAGMLCSSTELGLNGQSDGIWVLSASAEVGTDVFVAAKVSPTLTVGITPNRPDLLSHFGIAREVAAATGNRLKIVEARAAGKGPEVATLARVLIEDVSECQRYVARVVQDVKVGPSPAWLVSRLESIGQRPINNVVDATNYVLFELGQPLHAFDIQHIGAESGLPTIMVRRAREGETIASLDGIERTLEVDDLVIADPSRAIAIAGVMGGANSEVSESTTTVVIESAWFAPTMVRRTARRMGLQTEASRRFERGADWGIAAVAATRCAQILADIAGGVVAKGNIDVGKDTVRKGEARTEIALRQAQIPRLLGITLTAEQLVQMLEPLGIRCTARSDAALHFQPPSFRPDLEREVDLIEEVARRHGFANIPERLPDASGDYRFVAQQRQAQDVARASLLASGATEAVTYGFQSPRNLAVFEDTAEDEASTDAASTEHVRLLNPLGEEMSAMRTSLLPGLLTAVKHNQRHGARQVRLFEIGTTFHARPDGGPAHTDERDRFLPTEVVRAGVVMYGGRHDGSWYEGSETVELADMVGAIENLVDAFDPAASLEVEATVLPGMHPGSGARLWLSGKDRTLLGTVAQLHPQQAVSMELAGPVFVGEIDLCALDGAEARTIAHRQLPRFPKTRRDVAFIVERDVPSEKIRQFLQDHAGGKLGADVVENVQLFDVYRGKPVPASKVSLAFAIEYRHSSRTLTDEEVGAAFDGVVTAAREAFDVAAP